MTEKSQGAARATEHAPRVAPTTKKTVRGANPNSDCIAHGPAIGDRRAVRPYEANLLEAKADPFVSRLPDYTVRVLAVMRTRAFYDPDCAWNGWCWMSKLSLRKLLNCPNAKTIRWSIARLKETEMIVEWRRYHAGDLLPDGTPSPCESEAWRLAEHLPGTLMRERRKRPELRSVPAGSARSGVLSHTERLSGDPLGDHLDPLAAPGDPLGDPQKVGRERSLSQNENLPPLPFSAGGTPAGTDEPRGVELGSTPVIATAPPPHEDAPGAPPAARGAQVVPDETATGVASFGTELRAEAGESGGDAARHVTDVLDYATRKLAGNLNRRYMDKARGRVEARLRSLGAGDDGVLPPGGLDSASVLCKRVLDAVAPQGRCLDPFLTHGSKGPRSGLSRVMTLFYSDEMLLKRLPLDAPDEKRQERPATLPKRGADVQITEPLCAARAQKRADDRRHAEELRLFAKGALGVLTGPP